MSVDLEGLTDEQLFEDANSDETAETVIETPAEAEQIEQPRDEKGQFAAKADEAPEVIAETPGEKPAVDENAPHAVPSWRVREINEEKRQLADKVAALEAERLNWQRQAPRPAEPKEEKAAKPDPLLDPDGYEAYLEAKVEARILNDRRETSMANAHGKYKEEFAEAFNAAQQHIDPALKARMQQSRDPGETLVQWHREQKTMKEVGTDPTAWLEKKMEERLKDPAFLAKAIELARGAAQPTAQPGARPAVSLPPSLTRATNASADLSADDNDVSNDGLWRHANA